MSRVEGRRYTLQVGRENANGVLSLLEIDEQVKVSFNIVQSLDHSQNTSEISIFNLSEASRGRLQAKGLFISLSAGYYNDIGVIFTGTARAISHVHNGVDWVTKIQAGDGENKMLYTTVAESFAAGTEKRAVVKAMLSKASLPLGNFQKFADSVGAKSFANGYSAAGSAYSIAVTIAKSLGWQLSIQQGSAQFLPRSPLKSDAKTITAVLLTPESGLLGSPEHSSPEKGKDNQKPPVLKVKALLRHQLRPGGYVRIQSRAIDGDYLVSKVTHTGDLYGAWTSEAEVKPL